jgi:hypothetical protein
VPRASQCRTCIKRGAHHDAGKISGHEELAAIPSQSHAAWLGRHLARAMRKSVRLARDCAAQIHIRALKYPGVFVWDDNGWS